MNKDEKLAKIKNYIMENEKSVLKKVTEINIRENKINKIVDHDSFNGIFGGKNKTYNLNFGDFKNYQEYIDAWFNANEAKYQKEKRFGSDKSSVRIHNLLEDKSIKEFVALYLTRTFLDKDKNN